jgi:hypothetical protein
VRELSKWLAEVAFSEQGLKRDLYMYGSPVCKVMARGLTDEAGFRVRWSRLKLFELW